MKSTLLFGAFVLATLGLISAARADEFQLTYTFGNGPSASGQTVTATFDGTLNGDLITDISNFSYTVAGYTSGIETVYLGLVAPASYVEGADVLSLDGLQNNFDAGSASPVGVFYSYGEAVAGFAGYTEIGVYDGSTLNYPTDESTVGNAINSSYKVIDLTTAVASVPDESSTILLIGALLCAFLLGRRGMAAA